MFILLGVKEVFPKMTTTKGEDGRYEQSKTRQDRTGIAC